MSDKEIRDKFTTKFGHFNSNWKKMISAEEESYAKSRYSDSSSVLESLMRICKNIEKHPVCPICHENPCKFLGHYNNMFSKTCSVRCSKSMNGKKSRIGDRKEKIKEVVKEKYGVDNVFQLDNVKDKIKKTKKRLHDNETWNNRQKAKETTVKKYGGKSYFSDENKKVKSIQKKNDTVKRKYGVKNVFQYEEVKDKIKKSMIERYGVPNPAQIECLKQVRKRHECETRLKNGTFNKSLEEDRIYKSLILKFDDVKRQYKSEEYPHRCDFYIPSLDLYIEYNGHWTHGGKIFDKDSTDDVSRVARWKNKHSKYYDNAIETWTRNDVEKYHDFISNKLNFKIFWNVSEFYCWLDAL